MSARVIDVYAEVTCPFAHFGLRRFERWRRESGARDVRLRVHAWPLEIVNGEPLRVDKVVAEIADLRAQVAGDLFKGFEPSAFPATTILVLGAATLAHQSGDDAGERFNLEVRNALFERGEAIADATVLATIAESCGVDVPDEATARAAVERDLADGRRRGVIGSPHFFVDSESFFCPTIEIERRGDHLHIEIDEAQLVAFLDVAIR